MRESHVTIQGSRILFVTAKFCEANRFDIKITSIKMRLPICPSNKYLFSVFRLRFSIFWWN